MDSRDLPISGIGAYLLQQYYFLRMIWWSSLAGEAESRVKTLMGQEDNPTLKAQECQRLIKKIYHSNSFVIPETYLIHLDDDSSEKTEALIHNLTQEKIFKAASLFIAKSNSLVCINLSMENEKISLKEKSITIKDENLTLAALLSQLMSKDTTKNKWHCLFKAEVNLLVKHTDHNHTELLNAYIELIRDLGAEGLKRFYLSTTKHGVRTFILSIIMNSILEMEFIAYREKEQAELKPLEEKVKEMQNSIALMQTDKSRFCEIPEADKKLANAKLIYWQKLYQLCLLGDTLAVRQADNEKIFRELMFPHSLSGYTFSQSMNTFLPVVFQPDFYLYLLEMNAQDIKKYDYDPTNQMTLNIQDLKKIEFTLKTLLILPNIKPSTSAVTEIAANLAVTTTSAICHAVNHVGGGFSMLASRFGLLNTANKNNASNNPDMNLITNVDDDLMIVSSIQHNIS